MDKTYTEFKQHLIDYDKAAALELISSIYSASGFDKSNQLFFSALTEIGEEWNAGKLSLAQVYMSGVLCEELINEVFVDKQKPHAEAPQTAIVTLCDFHTLGKKILYSQLVVSGYNIVDLGQVSDVELLVESCIRKNIKILLVSVLMLPSALKIKELRACFSAKGYSVRIIAGGAPFIFNPALRLEVEADDTGVTLSDAMRLIDKWSTKNTTLS